MDEDARAGESLPDLLAQFGIGDARDSPNSPVIDGAGKTTGNRQSLVPEEWEDAIFEEAEDSVTSKGGRAERRRLKQRERRQNWRRERYHENSNIERKPQPKMQEPILDSRTTTPTTEEAVDMTALPTYKSTKSYRLSPQESDTRPTDWDLVCIKPGEYSSKISSTSLSISLSISLSF
ncbi:hypothetical protein F5Y19DRAFT_439104, partial [Xylariaceae sp. FL1651]